METTRHLTYDARREVTFGDVVDSVSNADNSAPIHEDEVHEWADSREDHDINPELQTPMVASHPSGSTAFTSSGNRTNLISGNDNENEDPPEVPPATLDPLPKQNIATFPQENKQYFATKNYVRNDKVSLQTLLSLETTENKLPPVDSVYRES